MCWFMPSHKIKYLTRMKKPICLNWSRKMFERVSKGKENWNAHARASSFFHWVNQQVNVRMKLIFMPMNVGILFGPRAHTVRFSLFFLLLHFDSTKKTTTKQRKSWGKYWSNFAKTHHSPAHKLLFNEYNLRVTRSKAFISLSHNNMWVSRGSHFLCHLSICDLHVCHRCRVSVCTTHSIIIF